MFTAQGIEQGVGTPAWPFKGCYFLHDCSYVWPLTLTVSPHSSRSRPRQRRQETPRDRGKRGHPGLMLEMKHGPRKVEFVSRTYPWQEEESHLY